jgi:tetratricopeptide (TPR) repeat protein
MEIFISFNTFTSSMADISDTIKRIIAEAKELEAVEKYDEAYNVLNDAIKKTQDDNASLAFLLNQRGIVSRGKGEFDKAFIDYLSVIGLSFMPNDELAHAYINIADIYRVRDSDFDKAFNSIEDALKYASDSRFMQAKAIDQKGMVYYAMAFSKDFQKQKPEESTHKNLLLAFLEYTKSRELTATLMDEEPQNMDARKLYANTTQRLGRVQSLLHPELIDEHYKYEAEALKIHISINNHQGISNAISTIGDIARKHGKMPDAIMQYKKALEFSKTPRAKTGIYLALAEAHASLGQFSDAAAYVDRFADEIMKTNALTPHDIMLSRDIFLNLFDAYSDAPNGKEGMYKLIGVYSKFFEN